MKQCPKSDSECASDFSLTLQVHHSHQSHTQTTQNETHLSDEVLREPGKSTGPQLEKALRAHLVAEQFAQDLQRVDKQTFVTRPHTVAHVFLYERPPPAIILQVRF